MKITEFTNIRLENFGKHSESVGGKTITSKLGKNTIISGSNACGKSTIKRAIQYILGTKDENGKEISGIRPHDENGVDIDGLTTVAELTVSVDGVENTLKRTCFQEKNRQGEYTGKDNLQYFVDDVKKGTKKAYDEFVGTIVPNMVCISAQELLQKDTAGRRAMLEPFSKHTTESIIDENPDFEPLRGKLRANTITDLKKACRDKIKATEKKRDEVATTIKVKESGKQDIDLAEAELHRNVLNEKIAEIKGKQADVNKQFEEFDRLKDEILKSKFELADLERKANEELFKKRKELREQIDENKEYLFNAENAIQKNNREIERCEEGIENGEKERQRLLDEWNKANREAFDESATICPTCHRELPPEEQERILNTFEQSKATRIQNIERKGIEAKNRIEFTKEAMNKFIECNNENIANKEKLEKEITELEQKLHELPESIDISDREDVKAIKQQIAEKEQAMQKGNSAEGIREQLQTELEDAQKQLSEVQKLFDVAKKNDEIDEEISKLQQKQRDLSQEIADVERELDLLKQFERKKAELLESDVNSNFSIIEWKMFKELQNGELGDICEPYVNGTAYGNGLNHGARLLAEIDISLAYQKLYEIVSPILLDDGESVNPWDIPNIENQIIIFKWDKSEELKIEVQ